jgi:hypothetical protein
MQIKGMAALIFKGDLIKKEDTFAKKRIMANDKLIAMKGAMEGQKWFRFKTYVGEAGNYINMH